MIALALMVWTAMTLLYGFSQEGDAAAGREVYEPRCGNCHQLSGEPNESIERVMGVEMRHLGSEEVQAKTDMELDRDIVEGSGRMQPVRNVSAEDRQNLIAYLRELTQE